MKRIFVAVLVSFTLLTLSQAQPTQTDQDLAKNAARWLLDPRPGAGDQALEGMKTYALERVTNTSDGQSSRIISALSMTPASLNQAINQESTYEIKDSGMAVDGLPFKNNHERNLLYASQLYDAGEREESLDTYYNMIAAYRRAGNKENEADTHEKLAYLYYEKDKQWEAQTREIDEQKSWSRSIHILLS